MARNNRGERDMSYGGFYGTSADGGYTNDYDNYNRSVGRDGGHEMGAARSMRGNDYYHNANQDSRGYSRSHSYNDHATGDMRGGTHYGEGGSTYGGGSGYGHSNYDSKNDPGRYGNRAGGSEDYIDYNSRNYGSFAGSREPDYNTHGHYNTGGRGADREPENMSRSRGYDRSFRGMPQGYGSTEYDERDLDRERSAYSNSRNYSQRWDRNNEDRYR